MRPLFLALQILSSIDFTRIYWLKDLQTKKQRPHELLWMLWFVDGKVYLALLRHPAGVAGSILGGQMHLIFFQSLSNHSHFPPTSQDGNLTLLKECEKKKNEDRCIFLHSQPTKIRFSAPKSNAEIKWAPSSCWGITSSEWRYAKHLSDLI